MAIVVDASVALAWALPDEISSYADAVLALVEAESLHVPELWPREVANGLAIAQRRKRITVADEREFITGLSRLTIVLEQPAVRDIIREATAVARQYDLTAYDAAYVALAEALSAPLVTTDAKLARAPGHGARVEVAG